MATEIMPNKKLKNSIIIHKHGKSAVTITSIIAAFGSDANLIYLPRCQYI